ncbi:MAG: CGLD27 family protein [Cyanobacteria bacterium P01_C01_bin.70]
MVKSRCPVPAEQLPINQYEDIRDSWFYAWGSRDFISYVKPILVLWVLSWLVTGPMVGASYAPGRYPLPFGLLASASSLVLPALALTQLYTGWLHIGQRLQQADLPYEESGWYDGQVWRKPEEVLNRDRLIMNYQVKPVLQRVRNTLGIMVAIGLALIVVWKVL